MIKELRIERFKSIETLRLSCKKVNVFIGEPDTGKTNLLDALQLLSCLGWGIHPADPLRLSPAPEGFDNLFYRNFLDRPFVIALDEFVIQGTRLGGLLLLDATSPGGRTVIGSGGFTPLNHLQWIRYYSFESVKNWSKRADQAFRANGLVLPPDGQNLMDLARHNREVNKILEETVAELGFLLQFDPNARKYVFSEVRGRTILSYDLNLLSDTAKRMFFYRAILATAHDICLVFDEPDVWAFPPYPRSLGELIADDESNQFFLTTHNPYFLSALIEKTDKDALGLFLCTRKPDGSTTARELSGSEVQKAIELEANLFFNLDKFTDK